MRTAGSLEGQQAIEDAAVGEGIRKYRAMRREAEENGTVAQTGPGSLLCDKLIDPVVKEIDALLELVGTHSAPAGERVSVAHILDRLPSDVAAFCAVRVMLNSVYSNTSRSYRDRVTLTGVASEIGRVIKEEIVHRSMQKENCKLYRFYKNRLLNAKNRMEKHRLLKKLKDKYASLPSMSVRDSRSVGLWMVDVIVRTTGIASMRSVRFSRTRSSTLLEPVTAYVEWMEKHHEQCELLSPIWEPLIVPPRAWDDVKGGGYHGALANRLRLIKTSNKLYLEELHTRRHTLTQVFDALNAVQDTGFRINHQVYAVLAEVMKQGGGPAFSLPACDDTPVPVRPETQDREVIKAWAKEAAATHQTNKRNASIRLKVVNQLAQATKYRGYESIWFAHQLDWRGRVYPVASHISPQGDDLSRSLLEFAAGVPLGNTGARWLAIHGANCHGETDKESFGTRLAWVQKNEAAILDSARNPIDGHRFWTKADKPWMFLAFCFEWLGYVEHGEQHISRLPVAQDGTCNGLQQFAALLRCPTTASKVNLVPSRKPSDIYAIVAESVSKIVDGWKTDVPEDKAMELIKKDRSRRDAWAAGEEEREGEREQMNAEMRTAWRGIAARYMAGNIRRKLVKRPCMTYAYSVTPYGVRDQLAEEMEQMIYSGGLVMPVEYTYPVAGVLCDAVLAAIRNEVVAAATMMDWLQDAIEPLSAKGLPVHWTTPVGLPVLQQYHKYEEVRQEAVVARVKRRFAFSVETAELDHNKQHHGIAPNYVHSLDAAVLMRTVLGCKKQGIKHYCMIHDSYSTHAAHSASLARVLRQEFVSMYEDDLVNKLRDEILTQAPDAQEIPDAPPKSMLDLGLVKESAYFFS